MAQYPSEEVAKTIDNYVDKPSHCQVLDVLEPRDTLRESREGSAAVAGADGISEVTHGSDKEKQYVSGIGGWSVVGFVSRAGSVGA